MLCVLCADVTLYCPHENKFKISSISNVYVGLWHKICLISLLQIVTRVIIEKLLGKHYIVFLLRTVASVFPYYIIVSMVWVDIVFYYDYQPVFFCEFMTIPSLCPQWLCSLQNLNALIVGCPQRRLLDIWNSAVL